MFCAVEVTGAPAFTNRLSVTLPLPASAIVAERQTHTPVEIGLALLSALPPRNFSTALPYWSIDSDTYSLPPMIWLTVSSVPPEPDPESFT